MVKQQRNMSSRPAWLPNEERQQERQAVNLGIMLDAPGGSQSVTLIDLSIAGCRLRVAERLFLGAFVTLRLGADCEVAGWVAWSRGLEAGVDFSVCLSDAVIARLVQSEQ